MKRGILGNVLMTAALVVSAAAAADKGEQRRQRIWKRACATRF